MAGWVAAVMALRLAAGDTGPCAPELFRVTRNTNANVVVYEARLASAGGLDPEEPVHPSWLMLAEDGQREELTIVESAMAYGVDVVRAAEDGGFVVSIRARPELLIRVALERGCPVAHARISGREARLARVTVEASGGLFPHVVHVDVAGSSLDGGAEIRERIVPSG